MSSDKTFEEMTDEELFDSPLGERVRHYADKLLAAETERVRATARNKTAHVVAEGVALARAIVSPLGDPNPMQPDLGPDELARSDTDPWADWQSMQMKGLRTVVEQAVQHARACGDDARLTVQEFAKKYIASLEEIGVAAARAEEE